MAQNDSIQYDKSTLNVTEFNKENLNAYKNNKDFNYEEEKPTENIFTKFIDWLRRQFLKLLQWLFGERRAEGVFSFILTALPYIIAILMLLLILKVFVNVQTDSLISGVDKRTKNHITEDEEIIKKSDIDALIQKALKDKNYRLAVRYSYLKALQLLEAKNYIEWEQQKTNHEYEKEIIKPTLQNYFRDITYLYDFVWYGNFDLDAHEYEKASKLFDRLETALNNGKIE